MIELAVVCGGIIIALLLAERCMTFLLWVIDISNKR